MKPHVFTHLLTERNNVIPVLKDTDGINIRANMPFFTVAETAQIVNLYLKAYLKEKSAVMMSEKEHKKASENLIKWRKMLKDWQAEGGSIGA